MHNQGNILPNRSITERRASLESRFPSWPRHTLAQHFELACQNYAQKPYLFIDGRTLTYAELWQQTLSVARALIALGVKRREHVALIMNNDENYLALLLATSMIGAVCVPVNAMLSKQELRYILSQSDSRYLFVQQRTGNKHHGQAISELVADSTFQQQSKLEKVVVMEPVLETSANTHFITWPSFMKGRQVMSDKSLQERYASSHYPDEVAIILYTSGSTGKPKGVMLSHDMLLRCAYGTALSRAIEDGRITLAPLPFYHCFALVEAILAMSFVGGSFISALGASPTKTLELMQSYQANDYLCVPTMLVPLVNHPKLASYDLSHLFATWCGAAPAPVPVWEKAIKLLGLSEIITGYGQTEVSSSGVTTELGDSLATITTRVGRPKLGGVCGLAEFAGSSVEYQTIDPDTKKALCQGAIGELVVRGNTVTHGYYNKPQETATTIDKDGWLRTGDVGRVTENGYLEVLGRAKEMFKVSGELVAPREVENVLSKHPSIREVQVIGVADSRTGKIGAAFVELKKGTRLSRKEMRAWCTPHLAKFKIPLHLWIIDAHQWPMTSTGKIQKFRLQIMARDKLNK